MVSPRIRPRRRMSSARRASLSGRSVMTLVYPAGGYLHPLTESVNHVTNCHPRRSKATTRITAPQGHVQLTYPGRTHQMQKSKLTLAVVGALFAMSAEAGSYVLQANKWGAAQEAAVAAAGGRVVYASAGAGIAVVDSDNAGFAEAMHASGTVASVEADVVLNFDVPESYDLTAEAGVTLTNETFWNLQWAPRAIEAPAAWSAGYTGRDVRVGVIDGGVFATHPDLVGRVDLVKSRNFSVPSGATAAGCTSAPANWNCDRGTFWHGTHVSGIIAARADNNSGTVGIAPD